MLAWAESEDDIVAKYNISQAQQESGDFNRKIFSSQIGTAMKNGFSIFGKIRVTAPNEKKISNNEYDKTWDYGDH